MDKNGLLLSLIAVSDADAKNRKSIEKQRHIKGISLVLKLRSPRSRILARPMLLIR